MKTLHVSLLIVLAILMVACQDSVDSPVSTEEPKQEAPNDSSPATAETEPVPPPADEKIPGTATTESVPEPADSPTADATLPDPSLFPVSWDERDVYLEGLAPGEEAVLNELPGATVYHLDVDISDPTKVSGLMEARYTNQEEEALNELYLHLFPAALGGDMEVSNILVNGEPMHFEVQNGKLKVHLLKPLQPGEQRVLSMDFLTTVPGEESTKYNVLAYVENILALAHFYPMFAVYNEDGWHTEPTAQHGDETFADSSFYLVRVTAPKDQTVVAAGVEIDHQENGDKQRITYSAGPMRDFYLAASDLFESVQQQVGPVTITSYAPADRLEGAELALETSAHAVQSFSERFGPYPYSELDIVSVNTAALGIEYPGIYANALRIYDLSEQSSSGLPNSVYVESTSAHEVGHQWFYSLVGNDQLNEPWLDEALTQYATWTYYVDRYGEQNAVGFLDSLEGRWARAENPDLPIGLAADAYTGRDYGAIVYGRGPIFLSELADMMGQETFNAFLRDYADTYRWQIADGEDFMTLAEQHCDCDLSELFAEQVFGH